MTTPAPGDLSARQAELDARTIYDIACIREARPDATREDVDFKAIALRNWQHVTAAVPVADLEGLVSDWRKQAKTGTFTNGSGEAFREALNDCADELTQLIKERSNG